MSWLPKKTVVVPVDFSSASADALATALQLVAQPQDVRVIYVAAPASLFSMEGWSAADAAARTQAVTGQLAKFAAEHNATQTTQLVREGDPGLEIADYAAEIHADLIVMPSHGYHGVTRVLLGSVTERVLQQAKCPVLVLRRQD